MKLSLLMAGILTTAPIFAADDLAEHNKRMMEAASVLGEILNAKDQGIPDELLENAHCVGVVPNLKRAGFIIGAKYGKGVITCRLPNGDWTAQSTLRIKAAH